MTYLQIRKRKSKYMAYSIDVWPIVKLYRENDKLIDHPLLIGFKHIQSYYS